MWECPKCGREFKNTNQSHYCGQAPKNVLEYIDLQPPETQAHLTQLRMILQNSVLCVNERILWSMPYYEKEGKSISFSACLCIIMQLLAKAAYHFYMCKVIINDNLGLSC